jgi:hypothetical protein
MSNWRHLLISASLVLSWTAPLAASATDLKPVPVGEFASRLYGHALSIVGLAVFVMFLIAGLAKMIPALESSVGKPTAIIKDAVIGLIILVSAYVILNSINPDLVQSTTP